MPFVHNFMKYTQCDITCVIGGANGRGGGGEN